MRNIFITLLFIIITTTFASAKEYSMLFAGMLQGTEKGTLNLDYYSATEEITLTWYGLSFLHMAENYFFTASYLQLPQQQLLDIYNYQGEDILFDIEGTSYSAEIGIKLYINEEKNLSLAPSIDYSQNSQTYTVTFLDTYSKEELVKGSSSYDSTHATAGIYLLYEYGDTNNFYVYYGLDDDIDNPEVHDDHYLSVGFNHTLENGFVISASAGYDTTPDEGVDSYRAYSFRVGKLLSLKP